jgi:signal transduction histidine kinase
MELLEMPSPLGSPRHLHRLGAQRTSHLTRPLEKSRLLVVDDENGPRQALRMLLKEDYEVLLASGVAQAQRILTEEPVDVVITDIRMPNATGLDLLRIVKGQDPDIQVIILTGYGQLDTAMEAIEHGAFAYLEKPFDNTVMLEKIHACLEKQRQEDDRRAMEFLAIEANRFETLGRLVSETMHDLATPLSVVGTHLDLLLDNPTKPDLPKRLDTMKAQIEHCTDLVRNTMNVLRSAPQDWLEFDFNTTIAQCLDVARPLLATNQIAVISDFGEDVGRCEGYLVLLRQAVLNLVYNAAQAMEEQEEPCRIIVQTWREEDQICLAVEDTGPGIPEAARGRIFETLYTTKGEKGTGLGLTVVRNVMSRHGGTITLDEHDGRGARFVLKFAARQTTAQP